MQNNKLTENRSGNDTAFTLQNRFYSLSKVNQRIASYILSNTEAIDHMTITQLAAKTNVSASAITRFCQELGFSGFPAFKYHLSKNQSPFMPVDCHILPNESTASIKKKLSSLFLQQITDSVMLVDDVSLRLAARRIISARRIMIFSQGGSSASAQFAQVAFQQIGVPLVCCTDLTTSLLTAASLSKTDVAIGISFSGKAKVPVDSIRIARENGAYTICISGFSNSPLMRYADCAFSYNCKVDDDMRTMNIARISEIGIMGLIHACVLSEDYVRIHNTIEPLKKATVLGRYT